jgi:hypothetical protein
MRLPFSPPARQFFDRLEDPAPDHGPVDVALIKEFIGSLDGAYRHVVAVLVHEQLRGAENVGVVDHNSPGEKSSEANPVGQGETSGRESV